MAVQLLRPDVQAFVETYTKAFLSVDGAVIAVLYHVPCVTVRADGSVHCLQSREELQSFFQKVVDMYHQEGCRYWHYADLQTVALGSTSALASLTWEMLREDGSIIRSFRQSYNLLRRGPEWKILASTFH
jgi:hypothetical protein